MSNEIYYDTPTTQILPPNANQEEVTFEPQMIPSPFAPNIPLQPIPDFLQPVSTVANNATFGIPVQAQVPQPITDLSQLQRPIEELAAQDYQNLNRDLASGVASNKVSPEQVGSNFDAEMRKVDQSLGKASDQKVPVYDRKMQNGTQVTMSRELPILDAINESRKKLGDYYSKIENTQIKGDFWHNAATWQKVMAGIGLALSAYGGPQSAANAVGIINGAIDRDIKLQLQSLEKTKYAAQGQEKELGILLKMYGDVNEAVKAKQMLDTNRAIKKMELMIQAGKLNSPQALESLARLQMQLQKHQEEMDGYARARVSRKIEEQATLNTSKPLSKEQVAKLTPEQKQRVVPDFGGMANTAKDAAEMKERIIPMKNTLNDFDTLISATYNSSFNPSQLKSKYFGKAKTAVMKSIATLRGLNRQDFVGSGVISKQDWEVLDSVFRNPSNVFSIDSNSREALLRVRRGIIERTLDRAKYSGLGSVPSYMYKQPPTTWDDNYFKTKE